MPQDEKLDQIGVEFLDSLDRADQSLNVGEGYTEDNLNELVESVEESGKHILAGLAELEAGKSVSNESVTEWLDSWGTENELPAAKKPAEMTLEELMEGIPEGAEIERIEWGPPRGVEFW